MQKMTEKAMREANGGKWRWYCSVCHKGGYTVTQLAAATIAGGHKSHAGRGAIYFKVTW